MALATDRQRIQHLLRRAGFGYGVAELDEYVALGLEGAVARLLAPEQVDDRVVELLTESARAKALQDRNALVSMWHTRLALSRRPLLEKMTYFWHDHFATAIKKVGNPAFMLVQNETLRAGALGRFRDLVLAVTRDPAMMVWLDNRDNVAKAPNENYAREMMELHTLGEGVLYTERDVKEAARALTGWRIESAKANPTDSHAVPSGVTLVTRQHDAGNKTILGETGRFRDEDLVQIVTSRRECAEHIGRKLWQFFAVPEPTQAMIDRTSAAYFANDTSVREMVRVILLSDEMYSDAAYRWRIKSPVEYVAHVLRALELPERATRAGRDSQAMGQALFDPPSPAGWNWGDAWINTNTVLARANFANDVVRGTRPGLAVDVAALLRARGATRTAAEAVDSLLDLLVGGDVDEATRTLLMEHIGGTQHYNFTQASRTGALQGLLYLVLTMPIAQLA